MKRKGRLSMSITATHLRCEYAEAPKGILGNPRFSWRLPGGDNPAGQSCYRLILSSGLDLARQGKGDIADTGFVESRETLGIRLPSLELEEHRTYYWRVQLADGEGTAGEFSSIASFITGVRNKNREGTWIAQKNPSSYKPNPEKDFCEYSASYMRKEFDVSEGLESAVLSVSGIGYAQLTVNGEFPDNRTLDPAWTDYNKRALYATYDISSLLDDGTNCLGVIIGNGRHVEEYGYGKPRLNLLLTLRFRDGASFTIVSDESWRAAHGPVTENSIYHGTRIDMTRDLPGWNLAGYDDSDWEGAVPVDGPELTPQLLPPVLPEREMEPVEMHSGGEGRYVFDFGQNMTGVVKLTVDGPEGTEIKLRYAELLHEDGTLNTVTNRSASAADTFVLSGKGRETFMPPFTYHGYRYVEVSGYPGVPSLDSLRAVFFYSLVEPAGSFSCSDGLVNRVHRNVLWGQKSNLMSVPTDCPQRDERQGWMGDAQLSAEEAVYNFDMYHFYRKYLEDIRDAQHPDGSLSDVIPNYWKIYPADPAWGTAYIVLAWTLYWYYGDSEILSDHFSSLKKYVEFLISRADGHILNTLGKYGDWCPPGCIFPKRTPLELVSSWYYYHDVYFLSRIADVIGKSEEAEKYRNLSEAIKKAFNNKFLTDKGYAYIKMSPIDGIPGQTSNTLPLYLSMAEGEVKEKTVSALLESVVKHYDYHFDTGIVGTRYILEVLTQIGHGEAAFRMVTRKGFPGFEYMLREGATTLWERWERLEGPGMNSHNHIMLGSIDAWFYRGLLGLIPVKPAWKKVCLAPVFPDELAYAGGSVETVQGKIGLSWTRLKGKVEVKIIIPQGVTGELRLPGLEETLPPGIHERAFNTTDREESAND